MIPFLQPLHFSFHQLKNRPTIVGILLPSILAVWQMKPFNQIFQVSLYGPSWGFNTSSGCTTGSHSSDYIEGSGWGHA